MRGRSSEAARESPFPAAPRIRVSFCDGLHERLLARGSGRGCPPPSLPKFVAETKRRDGNVAASSLSDNACVEPACSRLSRLLERGRDRDHASDSTGLRVTTLCTFVCEFSPGYVSLHSARSCASSRHLDSTGVDRGRELRSERSSCRDRPTGAQFPGRVGSVPPVRSCPARGDDRAHAAVTSVVVSLADGTPELAIRLHSSCSGSREITDLDRRGARMVYGAPGGPSPEGDQFKNFTVE